MGRAVIARKNFVIPFPILAVRKETKKILEKDDAQRRKEKSALLSHTNKTHILAHGHHRYDRMYRRWFCDFVNFFICPFHLNIVSITFYHRRKYNFSSSFFVVRWQFFCWTVSHRQHQNRHHQFGCDFVLLAFVWPARLSFERNKNCLWLVYLCWLAKRASVSLSQNLANLKSQCTQHSQARCLIKVAPIRWCRSVLHNGEIEEANNGRMSWMMVTDKKI